jgi:hypothetical protein
MHDNELLLGNFCHAGQKRGDLQDIVAGIGKIFDNLHELKAERSL